MDKGGALASQTVIGEIKLRFLSFSICARRYLSWHGTAGKQNHRLSLRKEYSPLLTASLCVEVNQTIRLLDYPQNPQTQNAKEMLRV
jgi:hypothetical protein